MSIVCLPVIRTTSDGEGHGHRERRQRGSRTRPQPAHQGAWPKHRRQTPLEEPSVGGPPLCDLRRHHIRLLPPSRQSCTARGRACRRRRGRRRTASRRCRVGPAPKARSQATAGRRLGWPYATDYRDRGRVRHLVAVRPDRESDPDVDAGGAGVRRRRGHPAGQAHPLGLRGGIAAAGRPRLRPEPVGGPAAGGGRRRGRRGQHDPDQRRAAVRRPRPPRVLRARVHRPAGRGRSGTRPASG